MWGSRAICVCKLAFLKEKNKLSVIFMTGGFLHLEEHAQCPTISLYDYISKELLQGPRESNPNS